MSRDCAGIYDSGVCIVAIQHRVTTAAAFINGKHDGAWPLEDTLTRVAAVASTGAGVKQINRSETGKETELKV